MVFEAGDDVSFIECWGYEPGDIHHRWANSGIFATIIESLTQTLRYEFEMH